MSLRIRLALIFALVAIITATAIAVVTPAIVDHGFAQLQDPESRSAGQSQGPGPREGRGPGRVQQETTTAIVLVAIAGAAGASVLGFLFAGRLVGPLGRLRDAAADLAAGNLDRRSNVADRHDEIGDLGRSFDGMASALQRSDVARRRLFQDAAHELKTPITVIDTTTTAILDGVYRHDDKHLETIREQSKLLARIVDELRTVSLAESGHLPLEIAEFDAAEAVHAVIQGFTAAGRLVGVHLEIDLPVEPIGVRADRERVRQMLGALTDNALRYTPPGGSVVLVGRRSGGIVSVGVSDSGPGIADEDLPRLFERFYRADDSRQRTSGTSGLGLAIVRALAEAQGGTVSVENVEPHGARFLIHLPAADDSKGT